MGIEGMDDGLLPSYSQPLQSTNNIHIFVMIWSRSQYSITLLSSVQRPSSRFVKISQNPLLGSVINTNVIGQYRYVERTISHQLYQRLYICNDLFTFIVLYHASQLCATSVITNLFKSPQIPFLGDSNPSWEAKTQLPTEEELVSNYTRPNHDYPPPMKASTRLPFFILTMVNTKLPLPLLPRYYSAVGR